MNALGTRRRIFVVEDEAIVAMELKDHLTDLGFVVCGHAAHGDTALDLIPKAEPDLVLMDINLGRPPNGIEVANVLRGSMDIPVVFVTAYSDAELAEHAAQTESFGYIVKPFHVQALRANIEMALLRHAATRQIRESEQRFRAFFEQAGVGVAEVETSTGRIVQANRKYADIMGYDPDAIRGKTVFEHTHPGDLSSTLEVLARLRSGDIREATMEKRYVRGDGATVCVNATLSAMWAPGEPAAHHLVVVQDITERKRAEAAVLASEAKLAGFIEIAKDAIILFDSRHRIVLFNEGAESIFGWRREEILGQPMDVLLPPRLREAHRRHVDSFGRGTEKARMMGARSAVAGVRKSGHEFAAEASISRLQIGGETFFTVLLRDVTERKDHERALRESEARYRGLFENAIEGVFRMTLDGIILDANPALARMLGYDSPQHMVGLWAVDLYADPPERQRIEREHGLGDGVSGLETRLRRADGSIIVVELSARRLGEPSRPSHYQGFVRDLTEERERAARVQHLVEQERSAVEANRAKTHFLANMSHELRTPLNAILGLSEALLEETYGPLGEKQERSLKTILDAGQHLRDLIEDALDIARVEAGKLAINTKELGLSRLVTECVALVTAQAEQKGQRVVTDLDPDVVLVRADRRRLKQILVNILSNASKFGAPGTAIILGCRGYPEAGRLEIWVSNAGAGIPREEQERIFEPFVRLGPELTREQAGAGLGLAVVKRLVELHGGRILVESEPGTGAKFVVCLPWAWKTRDTGTRSSRPAGRESYIP